MVNYKEHINSLLDRGSFPENSSSCIADLVGNKDIILYGAGEGLDTFFAYILGPRGLKPRYILDKKFKGETFIRGFCAKSPNEFRPSNKEKENSIVIVTVGKREYRNEIISSLRTLGFSNIVFATDIYEFNVCQVPSQLKTEGFRYYTAHKNAILQCFDLFTDRTSLEILSAFLETHLQMKPTLFPSRPATEQYFPADVTLKRGFKRFINCGSYNGDTIKRLNAIVGRVEAIVCFEPEPCNFALLTTYLMENKQSLAKFVIAYPCGVHSHEMQLRFAKDYQTNSMIDDNGDSIIECVAIDHVLPGFSPTYISMDIEGAEMSALKGAERTLRESVPDLAISVYHAPNHIWEIPLYIDGLNLGYEFFLRNYSSYTTETILYAVSNN